MTKRPSILGPTQQDIADALGIAQTTVALALNPKYQSRYAAATVERIQQKAKEMGYRPQRFAQIMRRRRSQTVGILVQTGPYESGRQKLEELVSAFCERDYSPVVADTSWFRQDIAKAVAYLLDHSVEGIAAVNLAQNSDVSALRSRDIPGVALNCNVALGFPSIHEDLENAFAEVTKHHLSLGNKDIVLLLQQRDANPEANKTLGYTVEKRVTGFAKAIAQAGGDIEVDFPGYSLDPLLGRILRRSVRKRGNVRGTILAPLRKWDNTFAVGRAMGLQLLAKQPRPTSILCANDDLAIGVLSACLEKEVKVPQEVKVSGHDATNVAEFASVPLTTIVIPARKMGQLAAELLISQIESGKREKPENVTKVRGSLIVRQSTSSGR